MSRTTRPISVLYVDTDPEFVEQTASFFKYEDDRFDIDTVSNVREAWERLEADGIDCVVAEYALPTTTGLDFLEKIRRDHPDLPFILYTDRGDERVASEAIHNGVSDYLVKNTDRPHPRRLAERVASSVQTCRANRDSRRHKHRIEQLLKTVPGCIVEFDPEGQIVYANDRAKEVLGRERNEVTGKDFNDPQWDMRDLDGQPIAEEQLPFRKVRDTGQPVYKKRLTIEWPDGTRKVVLTNAVPLHDDEGNLESVVAAVIDITEHWENEQELRETTRHLQAVVEASPAALIAVSRKDEVVLWNPAAERIFGWSEQEALGEPIPTIPDECRDEHSSFLQACLEGRSLTGIETQRRRKDGSIVDVSFSAAPIRDADGEIIGGMGALQDISERKEHDRQLQRQNERLQEFASVVSHDLRSPLNAAELQLTLAQNECESDHLDAIKRSHRRMEDLIEDVLTLARQGETVTETTEVELASLFKRCETSVQVDDATLVAETDAVVRADEPRLQRILENLIRNAVEHAGQEVTIRLGELPDGFYLEDDGKGIPEERRDKIFEPGYSEGDEGTGFGLSIVEQIAEAHDWQIRAAESDGGGARFEITSVERIS